MREQTYWLNQHRPHETCMRSPINTLNVLLSKYLNLKAIKWSKAQSDGLVRMQGRVCAGTARQFVDSRCTIFVVHGEQMALPLTPLCVFLSPSWTTAWGGPYLVKLGGGEGKALKARLCGDAIRQTAVGPQAPPPQINSSSPILFNTTERCL